jgi:hypothetical protein
MIIRLDAAAALTVRLAVLVINWSVMAEQPLTTVAEPLLAFKESAAVADTVCS